MDKLWQVGRNASNCRDYNLQGGCTLWLYSYMNVRSRGVSHLASTALLLPLLLSHSLQFNSTIPRRYFRGLGPLVLLQSVTNGTSYKSAHRERQRHACCTKIHLFYYIHKHIEASAYTGCSRNLSRPGASEQIASFWSCDAKNLCLGLPNNWYRLIRWDGLGRASSGLWTWTNGTMPATPISFKLPLNNATAN